MSGNTVEGAPTGLTTATGWEDSAKTATVDVVIPVFNEERSLPGCIQVLDEFLTDHFPFRCTITVVDNASTDGTLDVARSLEADFDRVRVLHLTRKGRGLALRESWGASGADVVVYMDVDLSTGLDALLPLVAPLVNGHSDLSIGSRLAPGSRTVRGPKRELISRCYNLLTRLMHGARFSDAQCGFKAARTEVVRPLLGHVKDESWFFDTELLLLAEHNGLRVHEVPVDWVEDTDSRVDVAGTAWNDVRGLLRVARAKASGQARVRELPRRPEPRAAHPDAVLGRREDGLSWHMLLFAVVGVFSTVANLALYAVLRLWWPVLVANLVALIITTLVNTEANRRFTFAGPRTSTGRARAHLQGFVVFGLYYLFTSAALLILHECAPSPSRVLELSVLLISSALGTAGRFLLLRNWVFQARKGPRMTAPTATVQIPEGKASALRASGRWRIWALAMICLAAGLLYAWKIGDGQLGNTYYSAAVKSMTDNFSNFLFGSFDPYGVFTVDKPPMSLWPQVISVLIFGYHGWSLLLPETIAGVAAVFLLHRTVRLWAGENVALLAALILAVTPITVVINRDNNPDTLLNLLLIAAAYAVTRSVQAPSSRGRTKWLLWCAFFVGCGFLTKMLQAWIIVPALALAFLIGVTGPIKRRILDLLGAAVVLFVSSFWWVALHDWWPGSKPYIGGSTDGTAWNLIFGYNGFGRIFGQGDGSGGGMVIAQAGTVITSSFGGDTGIGRMFNDLVGGQISWLLPLSLLVLAVVSVMGVRAIVTRAPVDPARRAGWFLWGGWLLVTAIVFSYAQGIWHPYYTTAMAPAIAALSAAGLAVLWRSYRESDSAAWVLLPLAIAMSAAWAFVLVSRDTSWHGWIRWVVLAAATVAIFALVFGRLSEAHRRTVGRPALVAGVVSLLLTPGVWSVAVAAQGNSDGNTPAAGPAPLGGMPGAGPLPVGPGMARPPKAGGQNPGPGQERPMIVIGGGGGGGGETKLTDEQRRILDYAEKHGDGAKIALGVNSAAGSVAPYLMESDAVVIGMGGFGGRDNTPSVDQLQQWVNDGTLRFILSSPSGGQNEPAVLEGPGGMAAAAQERQHWIEQHCTVVEPSAYGGKSSANTGSRGGPDTGQPTISGDADALYRCGGG